MVCDTARPGESFGPVIQKLDAQSQICLTMPATLCHYEHGTSTGDKQEGRTTIIHVVQYSPYIIMIHSCIGIESWMRFDENRH